MRATQLSAGLRVQRDGCAVRKPELPDAVAGQRKPAGGLDTERRRRMDYVEHGHRAQRNGKIDAYAAGLTQMILDISSYFAP